MKQFPEDSIAVSDTGSIAITDSLGTDTVIVAQIPEPQPAAPNFFYTEYSAGMEPRPQTTDPQHWILPVVLTLFFLAALIFTHFQKEVITLGGSLIRRDGMRKLIEEESIIVKRTSLLLLVLFFLILPVFLYQLLDYFRINPRLIPNIPAYPQLFILCTLLISIKMTIIQLLGNLFHCRFEALAYNITNVILAGALAILLIPIALAMKLSPENAKIWIILAGVVPALIAYLSGLSKGFIFARRSRAVSIFHIFLYFCTLELLPFVVVVKFVNDLIIQAA